MDNYKILMIGKICSKSENLALVKIPRLPKFMHRFKVNSVKIPEINRLIPIFTLKSKLFGIAKNDFK